MCVLITSHNFCEVNDKVIKKKIVENQAFYSRGEEININNKLKPYAKQMSIDLLEKLREKIEKKRNQEWWTVFIVFVFWDKYSQS